MDLSKLDLNLDEILECDPKKFCPFPSLLPGECTEVSAETASGINKSAMSMVDSMKKMAQFIKDNA